MSVVDASVLVEYLAGGDHENAARRVIEGARWVWAPVLVDAEVGSALRRRVRANEITAREARIALDELLKMRLRRVPHRPLIERAWQLRHNVTFYDGLYVALAEGMGVPLLTVDRKLVLAPGLRTKIELIAPV
jgi:predicted nucleic acid-binding protein